MKNYILLGILLLAGVSFANGCGWAAYLTKNAGCSHEYFYGFSEDPALYSRWDIAIDYFDDGDCFDYDTMYDYVQDMEDALWGYAPGTGLCYNAGCYDGCELESAAGFKSSMLAYNAAALNFNRLFYAGAKECMTEYPEEYDRDEFFEIMQINVQVYQECLDEEGPCYGCVS